MWCVSSRYKIVASQVKEIDYCRYLINVGCSIVQISNDKAFYQAHFRLCFRENHLSLHYA